MSGTGGTDEETRLLPIHGKAVLGKVRKSLKKMIKNKHGLVNIDDIVDTVIKANTQLLDVDMTSPSKAIVSQSCLAWTTGGQRFFSMYLSLSLRLSVSLSLSLFLYLFPSLCLLLVVFFSLSSCHLSLHPSLYRHRSLSLSPLLSLSLYLYFSPSFSLFLSLPISFSLSFSLFLSRSLSLSLSLSFSLSLSLSLSDSLSLVLA